MKLRPKYRIELENIYGDEVQDLILKELKKKFPTLETETTPYYLHIFIPEKDRKLWTPFLAITFEDVEHGVIIRCSIGPSGKIWLPFAFVYSFLAVVILFVSIYGLTQVSLGHDASILYSLIPMLGGAAGMYLFSYLGQKKSSDSINLFNQILEGLFLDKPQTLLFRKN
ncbi:MAG: hypothetical protein JXR34_06310 [Bacteroidales bacterium]|nr:hypothetical protein [Bacteroidales bacterium]